MLLQCRLLDGVTCSHSSPANVYEHVHLDLTLGNIALHFFFGGGGRK